MVDTDDTRRTTDDGRRPTDAGQRHGYFIISPQVSLKKFGCNKMLTLPKQVYNCDAKKQ